MRGAMPASRCRRRLHDLAVVLLVSLVALVDAGPLALPVHKYSTRIVHTKYGSLRGVILAQQPVEAFLGVPYASAPVGSLRYMPPVTPSKWRGTRLADAFSPVCPQRHPDISNRSEALLRFPRARLAFLERLLPLLANQSEDCLYMNIYVPHGVESSASLLPALVFVHGESFEWNSGNPYDGSVLAAQGNLVVITLNYRLGILGFLKTGGRGSAQGNFGLLDLVAGLHWLRENLSAFGGDPEKVTLLGHDTGAALANVVAASPVAKELLHRVVLLSGCALSPWALQREPLVVKRKVAEQTDCHGDLLDDDLAPCLRGRPLGVLMGVKLDPPRFLPGFAPFADDGLLLGAGVGGGLGDPMTPFSASSAAAAASSGAGAVSRAATNTDDVPDEAASQRSGIFEPGTFPGRSLLFSLTTTESYQDLSAQDLEFGFNETRRDRILRTFVRNAYLYHLNEIFATLKNEYTDWERAVQNPLSVRDATLEVLSDGHTAAPLLRLAHAHATHGGRAYFLHFKHQSDQRDFPQRAGSVRGEDIPFVFGLPVVNGKPFFPHNYSGPDTTVSRMLIKYLANFARTGDPNDGSETGAPRARPQFGEAENVQFSNQGGNSVDINGDGQVISDDDTDDLATEMDDALNGEIPPSSSDAAVGSEMGAVEEDEQIPFWDTYDSINQLYLELGTKVETHSHYRGHKMSLWLNLLPQLHRPGVDELSMRHHHFQEEGAQFYDGSVRPQSLQRPRLSRPASPPAVTSPDSNTLTSAPPPSLDESPETVVKAAAEATPAATMSSGMADATTECPPNVTTGPGAAAVETRLSAGGNSLLRKLATSHYQSYTTALSVTIAVGCFLLLLNILIFFGIYHQRDRSNSAAEKKRRKRKEELDPGSSSTLASSKHGPIGGHGSPLMELPLQEFQCSPASGSKRLFSASAASLTSIGTSPGTPPRSVTGSACGLNIGVDGNDNENSNGSNGDTGTPNLPEPPPPPKNQPPISGCIGPGALGILRAQGCPPTPSSTKKRVHIQEISV